MPPLTRTRQFVLSLIVTLIGLSLSSYGGYLAIDGMQGVGNATRLDMTGIVIFSVGAVFFAVGAMWLLVVMVRPFFEKRAVDRYADEVAERDRLVPPGPR
ncbi:MAG: hypothetical protein AB7H96_09695 [Vicinamibacterales bacterium]